jgi:hypothetical protein
MTACRTHSQFSHMMWRFRPMPGPGHTVERGRLRVGGSGGGCFKCACCARSSLHQSMATLQSNSSHHASLARSEAYLPDKIHTQMPRMAGGCTCCCTTQQKGSDVVAMPKRAAAARAIGAALTHMLESQIGSCCLQYSKSCSKHRR